MSSLRRSRYLDWQNGDPKVLLKAGENLAQAILDVMGSTDSLPSAAALVQLCNLLDGLDDIRDSGVGGHEAQEQAQNLFKQKNVEHQTLRVPLEDHKVEKLSEYLKVAINQIQQLQTENAELQESKHWLEETLIKEGGRMDEQSSMISELQQSLNTTLSAYQGAVKSLENEQNISRNLSREYEALKGTIASACSDLIHEVKGSP